MLGGRVLSKLREFEWLRDHPVEAGTEFRTSD
jgi:hypothetical protein